MDIDVSGDKWARIAYDVFDKLLAYLSQGRSWRRVASTFHLVNRHWRNAIRRHFFVLNPRQGRPFNVFRDVHVFLTFPNLHSIVLKDSCREGKVLDSYRLGHESLKMDSETPLAVPQKLAEMDRLRNLKIENPHELGPLLSTFRGCCSLECLYLKQCYLTEGPIEVMKEMTTLKTLKLASVGMTHNVSFVDCLTAMDQLKALDLSFVDQTWLGSVEFLTQLQKLEYIKISPGNVDFGDLSVLSNLDHLHTLILDGRMDGDRCNLSSLLRIKHLSMNCPTMPCWLPGMPTLQSLHLQTSDNFKNEDRRQALISTVPRLKALQLTATNAKDFFIRQVISSASDLEILKLKGHTITSHSIENLQKLKEISIESDTNKNSTLIATVLPVLGQLLKLESLILKLDVSPIPGTMFPLELNNWKESLTKLVTQGMFSDRVLEVVHVLHRLKDLRLLNGDFRLDPFESMTANDLPELKNLCLSNIRPNANYFHLRTLLSCPIANRLDHIGFKGCPIHKQHLDSIRSFRMKSPQVLIDDNLDWEPDAFRSHDEHWLLI